MSAPRLLHIATTDMSLALLLGPQLQAFAEAGYDVHAASATGPWSGQLRYLGVEHHPLTYATRSRAPLHDLRALMEVYRLIRRLRPAIVHTHNPKPGIYGRIAARAARTPVVVNTVHGLYAQPTDPWRRRAAVYALERLAASCSDLELVQNPEDLATLQRLRVPRNRLRLLGNGVDLGRFRADRRHQRAAAAFRHEFDITTDEVLVLAVGRLVAEKGYRELFAAAARLRDTGIRLVVAGGTEPAKSDAISAAELAAARAAGVITLGHREDVEVLYAAADVFVLASHREGFPRAAMEAAACGLPVIATDIRGSRQVVDDGTTGLLVPVRDAAALEQALRTLATDRPRRTRMGEAARTRATAEFDDRRVIRRTLAGYAATLAHVGLSAPHHPTGPAVRVVPNDPYGAASALSAAALHRTVLPGSFLSALGTTFLGRLYRRIVATDDAFLLVAEEDGECLGFCAATQNTAALYRQFARHDGVAAAFSAAGALLRRPHRALETWSYGCSEDPAKASAAELLALGVRPDARGRGLGSELVTACQAEFVRRGAGRAIVTVAADNAPAVSLYRRHGFRPAGERAVHRGTPSLSLIWP